MIYASEYDSPLGPMSIVCDEKSIIGLWFKGQRYVDQGLLKKAEKKEVALLSEAKRWLDIYYAGQQPDFLPPLRYDSTPFRQMVCEIMLTIPYGKTMTYGQIAAEIARKRGGSSMSAQAVGGAVGHNPIVLMIPCHRVIGSNGSLTGYGGGIERKIKLLKLEGTDMSHLFVPKKGTAL